jgi:hypothetical protein
MAWLDILEYYKSKLVVQYKNLPKAKVTIGALTNCSVCDGLPLQFPNAFQLENAAGAQLDILGRIVGVPRNIIGLDLTHSFFSFTRYDGSPTSVGFGVYTSQPDESLFLRYNEYASYTMSDFELRTVIKMRILYNTRAMTYKAIKDGLYNYFHGDIDIIVPSDSTDTWFTFTRYSGSPASHGFSRFTASPVDDGYYHYRYRQNRAMQIIYRVKTIYQNAFESALYLNIVPVAMGVTISKTYN